MPWRQVRPRRKLENGLIPWSSPHHQRDFTVPSSGSIPFVKHPINNKNRSVATPSSFFLLKMYPDYPHVLGLATSKLDPGRVGEPGMVDNQDLDDLLSM